MCPRCSANEPVRGGPAATKHGNQMCVPRGILSVPEADLRQLSGGAEVTRAIDSGCLSSSLELTCDLAVLRKGFEVTRATDSGCLAPPHVLACVFVYIVFVFSYRFSFINFGQIDSTLLVIKDF